LGNGGPIRELLDTVADLGVGKNVYREKFFDAGLLEQLHSARRKSTLRGTGITLHVEYDGVFLDLFLNKFLNRSHDNPR
jgi:hypothetical protein